MSFNNGPYIFSDVPGYEASKGERIVKAFQKLWAKINHLEQMKISEKNTLSQEVQASCNTDLTINDIKYEILLTQLRYIIKIVREYANDNSKSAVEGACNETTTDLKPDFSLNNSTPIHECFDVQNEQNCSLSSSSVLKMSTLANKQEKEQKMDDHQISKTGTQTTNKVKASDATEKGLQEHSKQDTHSHYHLKLNDVPFILGASATASHSIVANVQNIIALMKNHNKALCVPKLQTQKDANSAKSHKTDTQDANKMIQELSEDLTKLTMKQEKLKAMLDNASQHSNDSKVQTSQHSNIGGNKSEIPNKAREAKQISSVFQKNLKQPSKKKFVPNIGSQEKHVIPAMRIQTNENSQLARRKMLRSLKDFKTHLSEEDLSWK